MRIEFNPPIRPSRPNSAWVFIILGLVLILGFFSYAYVA